MNCANFCRKVYGEALDGLHSKFHPELKGSFVDGGNVGFGRKYFWVKSAGGSVMWEGSACCKWAARAKCIDKMMEGVVL